MLDKDYEELNQKKEKLEDLLLHGGINNYHIVLKKDRNNDYILSVECLCLSKTGFNTEFKREFYNNKELDDFINNIEEAMKLSIIGGPKIIAYPIIAGGISDFWYYKDEQRIYDSDLHYLYITQIQSFKNQLSRDIYDNNSILLKLSTLGIKYQDLKRQIESTKRNINKELEKHILFQKEIRVDNALNTWEREQQIIDVSDVVKCIIENDFDKVLAYFEKIHQEVRKANHVSLDISNILYNNDNVDSLIIAKKVAEILKVKLADIENNLNANIELLTKEFESIKEIVNTLNNAKKKNRNEIFKSANISDNMEYQTSDTELPFEHYKSYSSSKLQDQNVVGRSKDDKIFKRISEQQSSMLTEQEKIALNLYKSQLYRAFNPIINYARLSGININDIKNNDQVTKFIEKAYQEMYNRYIQNKDNPMYQFQKIHSRNKQHYDMTVCDRIFSQFNDEMPTLDQYKKLVYDNVIPLMSAIHKVVLDEDIVVYRGDNNLNSELIGITSSSLSKQKAKDFIEERDRTNQEIGVLYRIKIPKGTPVICFTDELIYGNNYYHNEFSDDQSEIIFDADLLDFDFHFEPIDFNRFGDKRKTAVYIKVEAKLKNGASFKVV